MEAQQLDLEIRTRQPSWMTYVLVSAAIFSFAVCFETMWKPGWMFRFAGLRLPGYPEIWQCVGLMSAISGIGYLAAASNPMYHWPIVLVGWLGNIAVPLWLLSRAAHGLLSWQFADGISAAGVIWWVPFGLILWRSYASHTASLRLASPEVHSLALRIRTNRGQTLQEMSQERPLLLIFLRHRGCCFCRETLADLRQQRREIERNGFQIVLVQMDRDQTAHDFFYRYGLSDFPRISDERRPFIAPLVCVVANSGISSGRRSGGPASKRSCSKPMASASYTPTHSRCPVCSPSIKGKSFAVSCIAALPTVPLITSNL